MLGVPEGKDCNVKTFEKNMDRNRERERVFSKSYEGFKVHKFFKMWDIYLILLKIFYNITRCIKRLENVLILWGS